MVKLRRATENVRYGHDPTGAFGVIAPSSLAAITVEDRRFSASVCGKRAAKRNARTGGHARHEATGASSTLPRVLTDVLSLGFEVETRDNRNSSANGR
jgi:hypothetical protein